jgi:D-beta-D-heptose 7-phosphate kinase/D-beta-D-heptose 1-phosphate adenosyltransferase
MPAEPTDLHALLGRARDRAVLIVGDLMLDHFVIGRVDRISPEAPVPVVQFDHESYRLGGAANVANNVASLGGSVEIAGLVGNDAEGSRLVEHLRRAGIGTSAILADTGRCTTRKLRVVTTRNQQVARIDYECDRAVDGDLEATLVNRIREAAARADVVLISDYQKGAVTRATAQAAIGAARAKGVQSLVDPKVPHIEYYAGASLITPNHHEAEAVTLQRIRNTDEARSAARRFRERATCDSVLITRGEHGMWLLGTDGEFDLPAEAREVSDVTGAGDTVIAAIALGLAAGGSLRDAARLANRAAGLAVARFGPVAITAEELKAAL